MLPVVVLAAGRSHRFGADKRQAILPDGQGILATTLATFRHAPARFVALRHSDRCTDWCEDLLAAHPGWVPIFCHRAEQGMGASLSETMAAVSSCLSSRAVMIALGDMPWIQPATLHLLAARASEVRVVRPRYEEGGAGGHVPGHPVVWGRRFWPALQALDRDEAGRAVLAQYPEALDEVPVNDPGVIRDIDRPRDLDLSQDEKAK
ncbi:nucleotidyltransferase family protein [Larsenimonas rhizosphaerae]|uniref:nucleotidyltransferase family protein n=1 Tax=Larsenimonas rhizosphaerae TaxID=2944682 RepID=UPI0020339D7B|nr:nucleotidyltransferase family protein [Larsenimonas rhizosphaerae]MCM2130310.1 nucleotidyltransferase family protein [Larsenimonas rhizosphaerae]